MRIQQIVENSTTAGSVATLAQPLMTQTRENTNVRGLEPVQKVMKGTAKKKGPYANSINEGRVKEITKDLKDLTSHQFQEKYKQSKADIRADMKKVNEDDLSEQDLIVIPGQGRLRRTGFVKHDLDQGEHEGETLKNSLHTIARAASELDERLSTQSEFPEWVSEKIGAAKGMMVSVMDYLISSQEMQHDPDAMNEGSERVDSIVTDALKRMKGPDVSDAVLALKRVLGDRAYNERRGFYSFYVDQIHKMYNQQGMSQGHQLSEFGGDATQFSTPTQSTPTTEHPPRKGYSIMLTGKPGEDWVANYAWQALEKVLPRDYPGDSVAAAAHGSTLPVTRAILKVQEVSKKGSAVVKTGIASEDIAETLVARLAANRIPAQFWRITSEDLDEGIQNAAPTLRIGNNEYKQWMQKIKKYYPTAKVQQRKSPPLLVVAYDKGKEVGVFDVENQEVKFVPPNKDYWNSNDWKPGSMTGVTEGEKDTSYMNKQHQDFYNKNPNFKRDDRETKSVGGRLATKVNPTNKPGQVTKKPITPFESIDNAWDAAKAKVSEGAKVDRMVKHIEKSEEKTGKSKKEAENIAWATANKRGMLDNKNKKK
jgi:hypothetical protein